MKTKFKYLRGILLFGLLLFLMAFAGERNSKRKLKEVNVHFTNSENLYITEEAVDNLLIQNKVKADSVDKETLDLSSIEALLDAHVMIENAEVFLGVDGSLGAEITQRRPIGRVMQSVPFYIDRNGEKMPLSRYYSARVPLVMGVSEANLKEVFPLLEYVIKDDFLRKHITTVHRTQEGFYKAGIREFDFEILIGEVADLERKLNNFKAFYQKAMKDKKLNTYKKVNLRFGNQVVSTKK